MVIESNNAAMVSVLRFSLVLLIYCSCTLDSLCHTYGYNYDIKNIYI